MNASLVAPLSTFASTILPSSIAGIFFVTPLILLILKLSYTHASGLNPTTKTQHHNIDIIKPQLLRCQISHRRLLPKTHAFTYRYLGLGVPVRVHGEEKENAWMWGWKWCRILGFRYGTHLGGLEGERGLGLRERLDAVLETEGIDSHDYPTVYLLTAPAVVGYTFSPASFWFLYGEGSARGGLSLEKVLAEVNNTFGEKRSYVFSRLRNPPHQEGGTDSGLSGSESPDPDVGLITFGMRKKDFHVSPFSSRRGAYTLAACDPRLTSRVDVCVTLSTSKGAKKLVARWRSSGQAVDVQRPGWREAVGILGGWAWLGVFTWPRIVFQAILLAQKKKLHIWYRPEPRQTTVSRHATKGEVVIADFFERYMRHLLSFAPGDVHITIRSGVPMQRPTTAEHACEKSTTPDNLELRTLTPQFYRQLITYPTLSSFLAYTLLNPWEENHTAASSSASALISTIVALEKLAANAPTAHKTPSSTFISKTLWVTYGVLGSTGRLRGAYPDPGLPSTRAGNSSVELPRMGEGEDAGLFLDRFVCGHFGLGEQVRYVCAALGLQWRTMIMRVVGGH